MYTYIAIVATMILCFCSMIVIILKMRSQKNDISVEPISDIEEIQKYKNAYKEDPSTDLSEDALKEAENKDALGEEPTITAKGPLPQTKVATQDTSRSQDSAGAISQKPEEEILSAVAHEQEHYQRIEQELKDTKEISKRESEYFVNKIKELEREKMSLKEALFREVSFKDDMPVLDHEREAFDSAKKQLQSTEESARSLDQTNQNLLKRIDNQKTSIRQLQEEIKKVKSKSYQVQNEDRYKIEELEEKLSDVIVEKEDMEKEYDNIEKLTTDNLKLKMKNKNYVQAIQAQNSLLEKYQQNNQTKELQMKSIISELQTENQNLLAKVKESVASVRNLKHEIAQIKVAAQQRPAPRPSAETVKRALDAETKALTVENEKLKNQLSNMGVKLNALLEEREQLFSDISRNEFNYSKLKEFNQNILEKEKILQYELAKSRAKTLGLERLCEDFKTQIEKADRADQRIPDMDQLTSS